MTDAWGHPDSREWPKDEPYPEDAMRYAQSQGNAAPLWHIHDECIRCGACSERDEPCEHPIAGPVERSRG